MPAVPSALTRLGRTGAADLLIALALLAFSAVVAGFDAGGVAMDSDAWDIIGIAQARDEPGLYAGDGLLGDPAQLGVYRNAYVSLVRLLAGSTGDYSRAIASLRMPLLFLHLLGFFLLGRAMYASRLWALLLAAASLVSLDVFGGEYYGTVWEVPLPRDMFLAIFPWLYWLAWAWRETPRLWPVLMLLAGLTVYVHPASGPQVGFGLWLAIAAAAPDAIPVRRRVGRALLLGLVFLAGAAPYLIGLRHGAAGGGDPALYRSILEASYRPLYLSPALFLQDLWAHAAKGGLLLLVLGAAGLAAQLALFRRSARDVRYVALWLGGILLVVAASEIQIALSARLGFAPLEVNFLRAVRYVPAWCLVAAFWPLAAGHGEARAQGNRGRSAAVAVGGLVLTGALLALFPPRNAGAWVACWRRGRLACAAADLESPAVLEFTGKVQQSVPPGKRILCSSSILARLVRAYARRPVVFGPGDGAFLYFADVERARVWHRTYVELAPLHDLGYRAALAVLEDKARALGADYVLSDVPRSAADAPGAAAGLRRVWTSGRVELLQLGPG